MRVQPSQPRSRTECCSCSTPLATPWLCSPRAPRDVAVRHAWVPWRLPAEHHVSERGCVQARAGALPCPTHALPCLARTHPLCALALATDSSPSPCPQTRHRPRADCLAVAASRRVRTHTPRRPHTSTRPAPAHARAQPSRRALPCLAYTVQGSTFAIAARSGLTLFRRSPSSGTHPAPRVATAASPFVRARRVPRPRLNSARARARRPHLRRTRPLPCFALRR